MKQTILIILILCLCLTTFPTGTAAEFGLPREALLSALFEADISALRQALELQLVTCEELTAYYLERITAYDDPFNCFITICDDALEVARQRDRQLAEGTAEGLLFGIPVVIKDNMDLKGFVTTNGKKLESPTPADSSADVVEYLLSEGAVIIAKTNMSTEAQSSRDSISAVSGETKNAYSRYMAAGGSSGGSAVAVSLNFAAAALGTDTNSSLRLPAALNGCVSLRPTYKLVSVSGIKRLNSTRDTAGAITRTVYDQALLLDVLTGGEYGYTENLNPNALQGLRIGVLEELAYPLSYGYRKEENADAEVAAAFENALRELEECGAEVIPVSMPQLFPLSEATLKDNDAALKDALYKEFQELLTENHLAAVVFPTYLSTPQHSGRDADGVYWNVWDQPFINNCPVLAPSARVPEISVPIGVHSLGAGIGMEIVADLNCEQLLLDIAYTYTQRFDHRQIPEGAPDTYAVSNTGTLQEHIAAYDLFLNPPPTETTQPTVPTTIAPTEPVTVPTTAAPTVPETIPPVSNLTKPDYHMIFWVLTLVLLVISLMIVEAERLRRLKKRRKCRKKSPTTPR